MNGIVRSGRIGRMLVVAAAVGMIGLLGCNQEVNAQSSVTVVAVPTWITGISPGTSTNVYTLTAAYTNADPRTSAIKVPLGQQVSFQLTYSASSANNSNVTFYLGGSADGTNYPNNVGAENIVITAPAQSGAITNRVYTTNVAASAFGALPYWRVQGYVNINSVLATNIVIKAGLPK